MHPMCMAFHSWDNVGRGQEGKLHNNDKGEVGNASQSQEDLEMCDLASCFTPDHRSTRQHDTGYRGVLSVHLTQAGGCKDLRSLTDS